MVFGLGHGFSVKVTFFGSGHGFSVQVTGFQFMSRVFGFRTRFFPFMTQVFGSGNGFSVQATDFRFRTRDFSFMTRFKTKGFWFRTQAFSAGAGCQAPWRSAEQTGNDVEGRETRWSLEGLRNNFVLI